MDKKTLVERCQQGDREALGLLYSTYSARMMKIIRHYIADPADAGDILHDGFIVAFTQIASLRNPDKLEFWLGTIMKNLSIQYLNQVELNTLLDEDIDITDMPEIQDLISLEELESIINLLPDGYRKVFKLAVLDNKSHREIGKLLGIAPHSSSSQLFRAKEMLRKIIREQGLELAGAISIIAILLALTPRLLHHKELWSTIDTNTPTPITLSIAKPATEQHPLAQNLPTSTQAAPTNHPAISHIPVSATTETQPSHTPVKENDNSTKDNFESDTENNSIADTTDNNLTDNNIDNNISAETGDNAEKPNRPAIYDYDESDIFFTPSTRKSRLSIGMQARTSGLGHLGSISDDIDNFQDNMNHTGWLQDPENPQPPTYPTPTDGQTSRAIHSRSIPPQAAPQEKITDVKHSPTLTFGITANLRLTPVISVESGISYSYLHSQAEVDNRETDYKTHYIGIPVKVNFKLYENSKLDIYGLAGGAVDFPISSRRDMEGKISNLSAPIQWSLSGGAGIQYSLTRHTAIYAEPTLRYNFHNSGCNVVTKWQDDRFEFTLPIGLRFNF